MPVYRVRSGTFEKKVCTLYDAQPLALAVMALSTTASASLGVLVEIVGGDYVGPDRRYIATDAVLQKMGRMAGGEP